MGWASGSTRSDRHIGGIEARGSPEMNETVTIDRHTALMAQLACSKAAHAWRDTGNRDMAIINYETAIALADAQGDAKCAAAYRSSLAAYIG